ncbi:acyl-CoA carboxylase subunit epsilon [Streptomyces sp. T-3]|nr:acyl-CoA carboxylase subunit epsilon [Streptomyces sp. T-3]
MSSEETNPPLLRIERGSATPEELAALTVVLMARLSAARTVEDRPLPHLRPVARWRRADRATGIEGPRGWQGGTYEPAA